MVAAIVLALAVCTNATAAAIPWDVTPTQPVANGSYREAPRGNYEAEVRSNNPAIPLNTSAKFEVSRTPTLGQDGTLANDQLVAIGQLFRRDSDPSQFYGQMTGSPFTAPGIYYFQVSLETYNSASQTPCPTPDLCTYASPVFSYTVIAPPPLPPPPTTSYLFLSTAKNSVLSYARAHYHGRDVTATCKRVTATAVQCTARYLRDGRGAKHTAHLRATRTASGIRVSPHS